MSKILIKNTNVITVNFNKDILTNTDIFIENNKIVKIAPNIKCDADRIIDARGKVVLPGFVQTHIHLCQTMFRGLAENRELLYWLREKIWPFEASHTEKSLYYSSLIGIGELISSGTTTLLDMGSVHYCDKIFEAADESGIRFVGGKAMMDNGLGVPSGILEKTQNSLDESLSLYKKWHGSKNNRIQYAFAPRFILSCSDELFYGLKDISDDHDIRIHTHSNENKNEGIEIFNLKGAREFGYFDRVGILNDKFLAAHCVWLNDEEVAQARDKNVKVLHCPSSNFKLGSGMLNLTRLLNEGVSVSIGADGAPCNNNLDMIKEIRATALMQNVLNKPGAVEAHKFIELATIEGAKALGLENEIGSIEEGKKADIIIMNIDNDFHNWHADSADLATRVVYSSNSSDIETVIIDGNIVMDDRNITTFNKKDVLDNGKTESEMLLSRASEIVLK